MEFIASENLQDTFAYLDNVTICGKNQDEHDEDVAADRQITYNHDKSIFSTRRLPILGYIIENGQIRPDPDRLYVLSWNFKPLMI